MERRRQQAVPLKSGARAGERGDGTSRGADAYIRRVPPDKMKNLVRISAGAAVVGALLLSLLPPDGASSHALSSSSARFGSAPDPPHASRRDGASRAPFAFARPRPVPVPGRPPAPLGAISETAVAAADAAASAAETRAGPRSRDADVPPPPGDASPPGLTVVAGPGARITSVSRGVAVEQDLRETELGRGRGEFVRPSLPPPPENGNGRAGGDAGGLRGRTGRVVVNYHAVVQDSWETKFDQAEFVRPFPPRRTAKDVDSEERSMVDYDLFPEFHGDGRADNDFIVSAITNEREDHAVEDAESNSDEIKETKDHEESGSGEEESDINESEEAGSAVQSAMAKSALLHRAGIAGAARKSSRSNGRSSRAKTHVNKSRRGAGRSQATGAMGRVLGTVRTAAAAAAQKKLSEKSGRDAKRGENDAIKDNLTTESTFGGAGWTSTNWNDAVQSAVTEILQTQDAIVQQESLGTGISHNGMSAKSSPPPGATSFGILGEPVEEKLPAIPPFPGDILVPNKQDTASASASASKRRVSIRSSIPHSLDDTHIANLRLSVFSKFDEEQRRIFRSRSVEVLNVRRRRGAVVLVAEEEAGSDLDGREGKHHYPTEMEARIAGGHKYGSRNGTPAAAVACEPASRSLIVTPVRGAKITQVSCGVSVRAPSLTVAARGAKITAVSSGVAVDSDLEFAVGGTNQDGRPSQTNDNETKGQGPIIGSVECSHQEFRGTLLGESRPKGSLMYVTEVAVRPDVRRRGIGALLMRGVDAVAALRGVESVYLHVDVANRAACAMYEKCGYRYLDKRDPVHAQFTASLNLHDGAMHGRKHYLMCKDRTG